MKVGRLPKTELKRIAQIKLKDLNTTNLDAAMRIVEGTARNMGVEIAE